MEPKFQTSFIPKKPVISGVNTKMTKLYDTNIFSVIATAFLLVTIITSGGLYFYKRVLTSQISQADSDINAARKALEVGKIQDLIDANSKIKSAKQLLEKHVAVSRLVTLLETLTLKNIHFNKLTYTNNGKLLLSLPGEAQSYNALIEQQKVFSNNEFMKNPTFSSYALLENGKVSFDFSTGLVPDLVSYKKSIEPEPPNQ